MQCMLCITTRNGAEKNKRTQFYDFQTHDFPKRNACREFSLVHFSTSKSQPEIFVWGGCFAKAKWEWKYKASLAFLCHSLTNLGSLFPCTATLRLMNVIWCTETKGIVPNDVCLLTAICMSRSLGIKNYRKTGWIAWSLWPISAKRIGREFGVM